MKKLKNSIILLGFLFISIVLISYNPFGIIKAEEGQTEAEVTEELEEMSNYVEITLISNSDTTGDTITLESGDLLYDWLPSPSYEGYEFVGWYTEKEGQGSKVTKSTIVPTVNQTYYAHYVQSATASNETEEDASTDNASVSKDLPSAELEDTSVASIICPTLNSTIVVNGTSYDLNNKFIIGKEKLFPVTYNKDYSNLSFDYADNGSKYYTIVNKKTGLIKGKKRISGSGKYTRIRIYDSKNKITKYCKLKVYKETSNAVKDLNIDTNNAAMEAARVAGSRTTTEKKTTTTNDSNKKISCKNFSVKKGKTKTIYTTKNGKITGKQFTTSIKKKNIKSIAIKFKDNNKVVKKSSNKINGLKKGKATYYLDMKYVTKKGKKKTVSSDTCTINVTTTSKKSKKKTKTVKSKTETTNECLSSNNHDVSIPSNIYLDKNEKVTLSEISDNPNVLKYAKYKTSDKKIASVTGKGVVKGVKKGTATITVDYCGKMTTTKVHVMRYSIKSDQVDATNKSKNNISDNYNELFVISDLLKKYSFYVYDSSSKSKVSSSKVTWKSSNSDLTISKKGAITFKGSSSQEVKLTAIVTDGKKTKKVYAYVQIATCEGVTGISTSEPNITIKNGETKKIEPIYSPATTNNVYTTYSSNNKKIATVSSSGIVTGTGVGTTTIFVNVPACGELNTPVKVTVTKSDLNPNPEDKDIHGFIIKTKNVIDFNTTVNMLADGTYLPTFRLANMLKEFQFYVYDGVNKVNVPQKEVKWISSNTKKFTVDEQGIVRIHSYISEKETLTAKFSQNGKEQKVKAKLFSTKCQVSKVELDTKDFKLQIGKKKTIKPTITPNSKTKHTIYYRSSDEAIATVDENGVVTAINDGLAYITVEVCGVSSKVKVAAGNCELDDDQLLSEKEKEQIKEGKTILGAKDYILKSDEIDSSSTKNDIPTYKVKSNKKYNFYVYNTKKKEKEEISKIEWVSSDKESAKVKNGVVSVLKYTKDDVYISAYVKVENAKRKVSIALDVEKPTVSKIEVNKEEIEVPKNETKTIIAKAIPTDAKATISYKSDDKDIAKVSDKGVVTGVKEGETKITAYVDDKIKKEVKVKVTKEIEDKDTDDVPVEAITSKNIEINKYSSYKIPVMYTPTDTTQKRLTYEVDEKSEDIISVDSDGTVNALKEGTATVTITSHKNKNVSTKITVTVLKDVKVKSVELSCNTELNVGDNTIIKSIVQPSTASQNVTYKSSDKEIAKVDSYGRVTALKEGEVTITVTSIADDSVKGEVKIKVTDKDLLSTIDLNKTQYIGEYTLSPSEYNVDVDSIETIKFAVGLISADLCKTDKNATCDDISINNLFNYESENKDIAMVDSLGRISGINEGTTKIKITPKDLSKYATKNNKKEETKENAVKEETKSDDKEEEKVEPIDKLIDLMTRMGSFEATVNVVKRTPLENVYLLPNSNNNSLYKGYNYIYNGIYSPITAAKPSLNLRTTNLLMANIEKLKSETTQPFNVTFNKVGATDLILEDFNDTSINDKVSVRVLNEETASDKVPVEKVTIGTGYDSIATIIGVNESKKLSRSFEPATTTQQRLKWESTDPETVLVDDDGNVFGLKEGSAVITATSYYNQEITSTTEVIVTDTVQVTDFTFDKKEEIEIGEAYPLFVNAVPANATNSQFIYESADPNIASINSNGIITGVSSGQVTIKVSSKSNLGLSKEFELTVLDKVKKYEETERIRLSVGEEYTINAPEGTTYTQYLNSSPSNVSVKQASETFLVVSADKSGKAVIKAEKADKTYDEYYIEVMYAEETLDTISCDSMSIVEGKEAKLDITPYYSGYSYTFEKNKTYIDIEKDGTVIAKEPGTVKVTVSYTKNPSVRGVCYVSVEKDTGDGFLSKLLVSDKIILNKISMNMFTGNTKQLYVTYKGSINKDNVKVKYKSDNVDVATVDENGLVTANKAGTATIKAYVDGRSDKYDTVLVTVYESTSDMNKDNNGNLKITDEEISDIYDEMANEKYDEFKNTLTDEYIKIPNEKNFVPQGSCQAGDYYIFTSYDSKQKEKTIIYIMDNNGQIYKKLRMDGKYHAGGVTFDSKTQTVYISAGNKKHAVQAYRLPDLLAAADGSEVKGITFDGFNKDLSDHSVSYVNVSNGKLYVGEYGKDKLEYSVEVYDLDELGNVVKTSKQSLKIPYQKVQGMTVYNYKGVDFYLFAADSYKSSNSAIVISTLENGSFVRQKTISAPYFVENISVTSDNKILVGYESVGDDTKNDENKSIDYAMLLDIDTTLDEVIKNMEIKASSENKPSIIINEQNQSIREKETLQYSLILDNIDTDISTFEWKSSDNTVATVSQKGKATGKKKGKAIITVREIEDEVTASTPLNVVDKNTKLVGTEAYKVDKDKTSGKELVVKSTLKESTSSSKSTTKSSSKSTSSSGSSKTVWIGDSRTVQLCHALSNKNCGGNVISYKNDVFSSLGSKGLEWMEETGIPKANSYIKKGNSVVILMGVNDVNYNDKEKTYVTTINKHANAWDKKGVKTYFVSVNPVGSKYTTMNYKKMNENINSFNKYLKKHLNSKVKYIDTNSGMTSKECDSNDGLHYSDSVYKSLYNKIKKQIK